MANRAIRTMALWMACVAMISLTACGGGGGGNSSGGTSDILGGGGGGGGGGSDLVSGTVTDAAGKPVSGALVVVGDSSATGFTNEQGQYSITNTTGAGNSGKAVRVVAPGYLSKSATSSSQGSANVEVDEDDDADKSPSVTVDSLTVVSGGILVGATIVPASGTTIADARAEVVGTTDGVVLTAGAANAYVGTIATSNTSGITVIVYAVDSDGKHGEDSMDLGGGPSAGSVTGNAESWVGTVLGRHHGGHNLGRYSFNCALDVTSGGDVSGTGASLRLLPLALGQSPIVSEAVSGSAKKAGKNYKIEIMNGAGTATLTFMGTVSADNGAYTGLVHGKIDDKVYQGIFHLINTQVRSHPWSAASLDATWGLSFHYALQVNRAPRTYQYNVILDVDGSGNVQPGTSTTIGQTTTAGATLAFADVGGRNLGIFTGEPGALFNDATRYNIYGIMGVFGQHVVGVWSSSDPSVGIFWGTRRSNWTAAHFDAQWQGLFVVTAGPDLGRILNAQVNINPNGQVTGAGSINGTITGGNIAIESGTLAFTDTTTGAFTGSFAGNQTGVPVTVNMSTPSAPATASMGVYHARLIGQFSFSSNGDSGYYFLFRRSNR